MQLDLNNKPIAQAAHRLAAKHHLGVVRKYTGDPYISHPVEVAEILLGFGIVDQFVLAAALLHDVLEDEPGLPGNLVTEQMIVGECGAKVARWVKLLSDMETGNRAARKAASCRRLAAAPAEVQNIKLADLISNTSSIAQHDPKFAATYLKEKEAMLAVLTRGDPVLIKAAKDSCGDAMNHLAMLELAAAVPRMEALAAQERAAEETVRRAADNNIFADYSMF